ncbi:MAG TPA: ammonium transporter [Cryptosporangiaceae bacterium]|nr:ammonium transporter [Cryptosporangiaceae bacterium]
MEPTGISIDSGATAWVLASSALVLLMTPGLAFFYGGLVRAKNVLGMVMQNFAAMAVVGLVWVLVGFSLAFGDGVGVVGDLRHLGLDGLDSPIAGFSGENAMVIPPIVFVGFQMMFAVITAALITGATADRWRFGSYLVFLALWTVLVYSPVAHWVFSPTGWAARLGALDFAGGTVVHVNAGAAALAMALVLGRRRGWPDEAMPAHNLPMTMLGAGLLWFGWIGFNAGSALEADIIAGNAMVNTHTAAAAALLAWVAVERVRYGKGTSLGAASGVVAGLVAITPAAGYVTPLSAAMIGAAAGALCALAVTVKVWLRLDDALDVAAVHLGAGVIGSISVGLFASAEVNAAARDGLFYGGGYSLLGDQAITTGAVFAYSFCVTGLLGAFLGRLLGNRVGARGEDIGLDITLHGETAYEGGTLPLPTAHPVAAPPAPAPAPARAAAWSGASGMQQDGR